MVTEKFLNQVKTHLNTSISNWNDVAVNITGVLSDYDPNFSLNF